MVKEPSNNTKLIGAMVGIFTVFQISTGYFESIKHDSYNEGRASLQQELNTQVNKAQDAKMETIEARMESQHSELKRLLEQEIKTVQGNLDIQVSLIKQIIDKQEEYLNEEDDGVKGDLLREIEFIQMQINQYHK